MAKMRVTPTLIAVAFLFAVGSVFAGQVTISDTEQQSNFNGYTQGNDPAHNTAPITTNPFNFTGQPQLSSILSISITLTIFDGDTGFGPNGVDDTPYPPDGNTHGDDDDFINTLHLQISGFDTGQNLLLNGFDNYDQAGGETIPQGFITRTIVGAPDNAAGILAALQNGTLLAMVYDTGFTDRSNSSQNAFVIPSTLYQSSTKIYATLSITGMEVPEPSSMALLLASLVIIASYQVRLRRKAVAPARLK